MVQNKSQTEKFLGHKSSAPFTAAARQCKTAEGMSTTSRVSQAKFRRARDRQCRPPPVMKRHPPPPPAASGRVDEPPLAPLRTHILSLMTALPCIPRRIPLKSARLWCPWAATPPTAPLRVHLHRAADKMQPGRQPPQGCIRKEPTSEVAPEVVRWAIGGGCESG